MPAQFLIWFNFHYDKFNHICIAGSAELWTLPLFSRVSL